MPEPVVLPLPDAVWDVLLPLAGALVPLSLLVPLAVVAVRYRGSDAVGRAQLRWLAWAGLVAALAVVVGTRAPGAAANVALGVSVALPAVAVVLAVTRHRLYDVDRLLPATVVYAALALAVVALDLVVFAVAGTALGERDAALAAVAVVAVVYAPLRERLWAGVRRGLRGRREDRYGVVSALAERLEGSGTAEEQLLAVARSVAEAFRTPYVLVEVEQAGGGTLAVRHGDPDAAGEGLVVLPVTYRGEVVGRLALAGGAGLTRLRERDQRLLADVVRQAAAAARATALSEQLQRSRGEIVAGREEERRRLRRDLHDGLGPSLAAVSLRIETARNLARSSPEEADRLLEQATDDVASVLGDVRRLVHDLRPPALDELGLAGAVRQLAARLGGDGLEIRVATGDLGPLPAAVEVAAYRIVAEALTNVRRHAAATVAEVGLVRSASGLEVSVRDDGAGIGPQAAAGVGLLSLRERAAELGGSCAVTCPAGGGTLVTALLPLDL
jgi:signal transduction histidine kinase